MTPPPTVDSDDERDDVATEAAIAAMIVEMIAHPAHPGGQPFSYDQLRSMLESSSLPVRTYVTRVGTDFLEAAGVSAEYAAALADLVPRITDEVLDEAALSAERAVQANNLTYEGGIHGDTQLYSRLTTGMERTSRLVATQARELIKYTLAQKMGCSGKVWRTRRDDRVRVSHGDLEGEYQPLDSPFVTIRGAELDYPGQVGAPLTEVLGCRCRLSYRMPA